MSDQLNRRDFLVASATAGLAAAAPRVLFGEAPATPAIIAPKGGIKPVVVSSANGNVFKNGGDMTGVQKAFTLITQGADVLDALVAGVNILELDPEEDSVGYGGLPNAEGVVQLDSCCMHGPRKQAGGVASLEGIRTPSLVARAVLEQTDHHLLVGKGAQEFARGLGFKIEDDLNTEHSRRLWLEWKRRTDPEHYLDPKKRAEAGFAAALQMASEGLLRPEHLYGTINCDGVNAKGEVCGVTTTSGLSWKIPGRVGDSPILGAGLYVDGDVGAAGSTGRGEANLYNLSSFFIVEEMRRGAHPKDAGMAALKRVAANTVEKRLRNDRGQPNFGLNFYVLNKKGEYAGVSMYPSKYAVCTENGPQTLPTEALYPGQP
ncbi:MAG TPA: N(4)-(beta-N-acetylglucosaminyl)-L-asparaginase [Thermoanaerobaculia bacterium]|jgi:N4-(beta-N-acetylglucosaminyl)-L-asparaginase|nr:N(4)-(beta-N-acetylglucosaminyl)-L-asparaginase [Thermoanaerobaculia bacterium]